MTFRQTGIPLFFFWENFCCYWLLIIVRLKGGTFLFLGCWSCPVFWLFTTCMDAHFPAIELDNAIRFSTLSMVSSFLWCSSKWVYRFHCFLQYTWGLQVLACSFDTDFSYVITILQLHPSLKNQFQQHLGGRWISKLTFLVYSQRQMHNHSSTLSRTQGP